MLDPHRVVSQREYATENTFLASTHKNMFSVGLMTSLNGLLIVFASPTTRTPGFLQALLVNITYVHTCLVWMWVHVMLTVSARTPASP